MSKNLLLSFLVLSLTSLQIACGDAGFTANQSLLKADTSLPNEPEATETEEAFEFEVNTTTQLLETNTETNKPNTPVKDPQPVKPEVTTNNEVKPIKEPLDIKPQEEPVGGKPLQVTTEPIKGELGTKPIIEAIQAAINSQQQPTVPATPSPMENNTAIQTIEEEKACIDLNGNGSGFLSGTQTPCTGPKQLNSQITSDVLKSYNTAARKSFQVTNGPCQLNLSSFENPIGCFQSISNNSDLFRAYATQKGITQSGAIAKFYPAGNTTEPLNKTIILVSPYNALGSSSIDKELNWIFSKAKRDGSTLPDLLNYLHRNGISVLYVSYAHPANTSQPLLEKSRALAEIIIKFNNLRSSKESNEEFEKTHIMGLSLGGVVAKKALTLLEDRNIDHKVNLYMSMDSPHLGAHVPLGLQRLPEVTANIFEYAKDKTDLAGIFDFFIDDIFDIDFITDPIAQGAGLFGQAADAASNFIQDNFNDIPSNELLVYSILAEEGLITDQYRKMRQDTARMPARTGKNIAITNGSITGVNLPAVTYLHASTSKRNDVKIKLTVNPRGIVENYSYAWIEFPNRNTFFLGSRTRYSRYTSDIEVTEDRVPCATTKEIIAGAELGINTALAQNWNERVEVHNYNSCFIPTASSLASLDGNQFYNGSFSASQSAFHEIIGSSVNTEHMFFSRTITTQIINKLIENR